MAIHKRLTDRFKLIFIHDEALSDLPTDMVAKWHANGRNIEDLNLDLCATRPTVFDCSPLGTDEEPIRDQVISGASGPCWQIFKRRVHGATNCEDENGKQLLEWEGDARQVVKDVCRDNMPPDVVADIAAVICGKSEEASAVFTLPVTFWDVRARSLKRRALDVAGKKPASEKSSESPQSPPKKDSDA